MAAPVESANWLRISFFKLLVAAMPTDRRTSLDPLTTLWTLFEAHSINTKQ